jgi:hypothetical protein
MIYKGFKFLCFFMVTLSLSLADSIVLTDIEGRQLECTLVDKTQSSVLIKNIKGEMFDIPLVRLSKEDRKYLSRWTPPKPEPPENPIDSVVIMRTKDGEKKGFGTGFFAYDKGKIYIYTNQHVLSDILNIEAVDSSGNPVTLGQLEVSNSQDLARFEVMKRPALLLIDSVKIGEEVTALGNSIGAGVITSETGKINGIGPKEIEVSCNFVPGNSGGPVINSLGLVIGVATYLKAASPPDWVKNDTRYTKARRFTIRPSRVDDWIAIKPDDYGRQLKILNDINTKLDQVYWAFEMLSKDGDGYVSRLPANWDRDILEILRNHNSRQLRPDSETTTYYNSYGYIRSETKDFKKKKEASRRTNLRALERYVKTEFRNMHRVQESYLDVAYFVINKYNGLDLVKQWIESLNKNILKEIEFSKEVR